MKMPIGNPLLVVHQLESPLRGPYGEYKEVLTFNGTVVCVSQLRMHATSNLVTHTLTASCYWPSWGKS